MNKYSLKQETCADGIVLLAKQSGLTSFSSLNDIKHSLNTKKVGHTGTLDSFAQGLLVACVGRLTRLAGNITEFDKDYSAVIKFGEETDTLEYTGAVVRTAPLPSLEKLKEAVVHFTGEQLQQPPDFSAIHVNGKRASDLVRQGKSFEIPSRKITVFSAKLIDYKLSAENLVEYCQIDFSVSKGTYIRSLARDIALFCGSAGHLAGLYRTRIGNFKIEDAAGFNFLKPFTIDNVIKAMKEADKTVTSNREELHEQIKDKLLPFTEETAKVCGFYSVHLKDSLFEACFKNGKNLSKAFFMEDLNSFSDDTTFSVFTSEACFTGLITKSNNKLQYKFVIN